MILATLTFMMASLLGDLSSPQSAAAPAESSAPAVEEVAAPAVPAAEAAAPAEEKPALDVPVAAEAVAPAPEEGAAKKKKRKAESEAPRSVRITSDRTDYDRKEGVIMFDGNVHVDDEEYQMCSRQLYVFLDGTNDLKRIVAIGNVAITNDTRHGSCAKAAYTKSVGKIVMYGDGQDVMAKLVDDGKRRSEVVGRKITFWIDSEQVEVEGSTVTLDAGGMGGKEGAKKLLGK